MIDLDQIVGFDWDDGNARKSFDKHSVSQAEAEQVFSNEPLLLLPDDPHSFAEARYNALGKTNDGRLLYLSFTLRSMATRLRVISARPMNRKEREIYDQET